MGKLDIHYSSKQVDHRTPHRILDAVVKTLGRIDLDPCSNPGIPHVPCKTRYTEFYNGLIQTWSGRVFMNPPYKRYVINKWVDKLVESYESGEVGEAIALVPARTDTKWFRMFGDFPICFVHGRLRFVNPGNDNNPAPFPSAIVYMGNRVDEFYHCFTEIGSIWSRMDSFDSYMLQLSKILKGE